MKVYVRALETKEQLMSELEFKNFLLNHYRDVIERLKKQNQENNALNDDLQERINKETDNIAEKDTIIEDLREKLEKATIDYQSAITENKMLKEQTENTSDCSIESLDELENIVNKTHDEKLIDELINELESTKMMLSTLKKEYDTLQKQYDGLKKTYEETKEKDARVAFEMGQSHAELYKQLREKTIDYNVLEGEYDHLKAEFNKLYGQYLSYMDKIQKFITDIKGEATDFFKEGDKEQ